MNKVKDWLRHLILTCIISLSFAKSYAQKLSYVITFSSDTTILEKVISGEADSLQFEKIVKEEVQKYLKRGYLLASAQIQRNDSLNKAAIYTGVRFRWGYLNVNDVPESLLSKAGFRKNQFKETLINASNLGSLLTKIVHESEMQGYPFALVKLDSIVINKEIVYANVTYNPGPEIKYSNLVVSDESILKSNYLESYLGVNQGDVFNSERVDDIPKKIRRLSYCKLKKTPIVKFEKKSCKIELDIQAVKANKIDAMIGLAPNQLANNKLLATGHINLNLQNLFKSGKELSFNWRQYGFQAQKLAAYYNHTNLFGSVINVKGAFDLTKQDTSFINRDFYLTIGYNKASYTLNLTSKFQASRLLSEIIADGMGSVPQIDFDAQYYGVELLKNELDDRNNPTNGWSLSSGIDIGAKKIRNTQFVPVEVYDNLSKQMVQGSASLTGELALPLSPLFVAYTKISGATLETSGLLFNNDLFRLGGVNSLRGFNEMGIYASSYVLMQLEGRLLLGPDSRLFGFVDWAHTENKVAADSEQYLGLGAGIFLETSVGSIQLVLAVGKSAQQSLSLTESKIHLGYVAKF